MSEWVMAGEHAVNMQHVVRVLFPEEHTAVVFFDSLEERICEDCERPSEGLQQAWMVIEGEGADDLRRYIAGAAKDTRTPVPPVFHEG